MFFFETFTEIILYLYHAVQFNTSFYVFLFATLTWIILSVSKAVVNITQMA